MDLYLRIVSIKSYVSSVKCKFRVRSSNCCKFISFVWIISLNKYWTSWCAILILFLSFQISTGELNRFVLNTIQSLRLIVFSFVGLSWICKWTSNGSLLAYQGHGIAEWKNDAKFFRFFINKNGHVLDRVDYQRCMPKGAINRIDGKKIVFCDGTEEIVDVIIQCTGYKTEFPLLPVEFQRVPLMDNYKYIFNVEDPTLAFVGYVRPVVGSISGVTEIQSRFVGKVFSGKCGLPPRHRRYQEAMKDKDFWDDHFKDSSRRLGTLVDGYTYIDDIGSLCGIKPDYWKLLWRNPRGWLLAVFAPYGGCSFRLNEPENEAWALKHLRVHMSDTLSPTHLLLIAFLRFIWFDFWLNILSEIKYRIQCAGWWKKIRDCRLVRTLDWCWQAPKRWLFDRVTRSWQWFLTKILRYF